MNLTDEAKRLLNEAVREWLGEKIEPARFCGMCGFDLAERTNPYKCTECGDTGEIKGRDYCADRNVLTEIWSAVKKSDARSEYMDELLYLCHPTINSEAVHQWLLMTAEPHLHVIAALRACGKMTDDLEKAIQEGAEA